MVYEILLNPSHNVTLARSKSHALRNSEKMAKDDYFELAWKDNLMSY